MKFHSFAFIFIAPGFTPEDNTIETSKDGYAFRAVGVDIAEKERCLEVAEQLAKEGFQMIEICGGFGPEWAYKISEHLNNQVPVGAVFYGPQFRQQLADLFKPE